MLSPAKWWRTAATPLRPAYRPGGRQGETTARQSVPRANCFRFQSSRRGERCGLQSSPRPGWAGPLPIKNRLFVVTRWAGEECRVRSESSGVPGRADPLVLRWRDDNTAIGYVPFFASLKINRSSQLFVAVQGAARDAWNFFVIDDRLAILNDGDPTPDQRDIEALPFSRLAG